MMASRTSGRWLNTSTVRVSRARGCSRRELLVAVGTPTAPAAVRPRPCRDEVSRQAVEVGGGHNASVTTAAPTISPRIHSLNRPNMVSVGTIVWLSSELMFFAGLFAIYFTARAQNAGPRGRRRRPSSTCPYALVVTIILVASSFTCQFGVFAAERGDVFGLRRWYLLTLVMGTPFVLGQAYEYFQLAHEGTTIPSSAYGTVFYLTTGFHALHVTGGLFAFIYLLIRTKLSKFTPRRPPPRSSCRTTGTSSTSSGSACSPSSTSSVEGLVERMTSTHMTTEPHRRPARSKLRRRVAAGLAMGVGAARRRRAVHRVHPGAADRHRAGRRRSGRARARQLFDNHCITCHGLNLQGVTDRGPSLIGVGDVGGLLPGLHRPDAAGPPGGPGGPQAAARRSSTRTPRRGGNIEALGAYTCRPAKLSRICG